MNDTDLDELENVRHVHHDRRKWGKEVPPARVSVVQVKTKPGGEAAPEIQKLEKEYQTGGWVEWLLLQAGVRIKTKPPR